MIAHPEKSGGREIIYNPDSETGNGIEVTPSAFTAVNSGFNMVERLVQADTAHRLVAEQDGKGHLTTKLALIALYGMNRFAAQMRAPSEPYARRRTELAEAIIQKAYGRTAPGSTARSHGPTYYPEPSAVQYLLEDEQFLREMLEEDEGVGRIVVAYIENYMAQRRPGG